MSAATAAGLFADLDGGLWRLKLAAMRRLEAELLTVRQAQRWSPEEFLRTLIDAEITSRDESNTRTRMKAAAFPVVKTIAEFDVAASSIPRATFDYPRLPGVDPGRRELLRDRAGTGKSDSLIASGVAAVQAGTRSTTSPPRTWPKRSTGPGRQLRRPSHREHPARRPGHRGPIRGSSRPVRNVSQRGSAAVSDVSLPGCTGRHSGPIPARAHHRRQPARPPPASRGRRRHRRRVVPHATGPNPRRWTNQIINPEGWRLLIGHQRRHGFGR